MWMHIYICQAMGQKPNNVVINSIRHLLFHIFIWFQVDVYGAIN